MRHPFKSHATHRVAEDLSTQDPATTNSASAALSQVQSGVTETTLASFDGTDGSLAIGELVMDGSGNLFGVTQFGGADGAGAVFELPAGTGQINDLYSFTEANGDGGKPTASLSMDIYGNLYGTTIKGGANNFGTVFELRSLGNSFSYAKVADVSIAPASGVYVGPDGTIIGTTSEGVSGTGSVFTIAPGSSTPVTTSFPPGNATNNMLYGPYPISAPTKVGSSLYSTTYGDASTANPGTIFAFNPQTSKISTVATFSAATGYTPEGGVVADSAGDLFGTTQNGAGDDFGSIYEYNATTGTTQALASFDGTTGYMPYGSLLRDGAGDLFGTTYYGGADGDGTVFELKAGSSMIDVLYNFTGQGNDGGNPQGGLIADSAGNLYGTTNYGGSDRHGTVYEIQGAGFVPVCFAAGTSIRTLRGGETVDVAVEALAAGDLVVTASGATRPVRWLGHREIDCRAHPRPHEAMPVRVAAHAFAPNRPARDLLVSPGHAICLDFLGELLIPIGKLVNGATIARHPVENVTYWHVELDSHDILIAENLPAESFLDCGNRAGLVEQEGDFDRSKGPHTPADFCRRFVERGAVVEAARERLADRAELQGWRSTGDMDLHLIVDGARIEADILDGVARFLFPAAARDVALASESVVPSDLEDCLDHRRLGLSVTRIEIDDGLTVRRAWAAGDPWLAKLFHPEEAAGEARHRFTNGHAVLPLALWDGCRGFVILRIGFDPAGMPHWLPPGRAEAGNVVALRVA